MEHFFYINYDNMMTIYRRWSHPKGRDDVYWTWERYGFFVFHSKPGWHEVSAQDPTEMQYISKGYAEILMTYVG